MPINKEVELTSHAEKKDIPDFEIKNILEKEQGKLFYDRNYDSKVRSKGKTVVAYEDREDKLVAITAYRKGSSTKFSNDRFQEITVPKA